MNQTLAAMYIYTMLTQYDGRELNNKNVQKVCKKINRVHMRLANKQPEKIKPDVDKFIRAMRATEKAKTGTTLEITASAMAMYDRYEKEIEKTYGVTRKEMQAIFKPEGRTFDSVRVVNEFIRNAG